MSQHSAKQLLSEATGTSSDTVKVVEMSSFGNPKQYFSLSDRKLGCHEEMKQANINLDECVNARTYCDEVMQRYIVVLDNATFMPCEHIQKEKEYGIIWRSAFKAELYTLIDSVSKRLISSDGFNRDNDPFEVLHKVVKKDCIDAATFDMRTQADLLCMLVDNLELLEKVIFQIKAMLKEPMPENFDACKKELLEKVRVTQKAANPERPETAPGH